MNEITQPKDLLRDIEATLLIAKRAAYKLDSMYKRGEVSKRHELDLLIERREIIRDQIKTLTTADAQGCPLYSEYERDGMYEALKKAQESHGMYESLFAVATFILRARGLASLPEELRS